MPALGATNKYKDKNMFCPNCGDEYQEGIDTCPACKVDLVNDPTPTKDPGQSFLVTVLRTNDISQLMLAKSLLHGASIPYFAKSEIVQDFFGVGRIGTGFNVITGPVELQVARDHEKKARELLAELEDDNSKNS